MRLATEGAEGHGRMRLATVGTGVSEGHVRMRLATEGTEGHGRMRLATVGTGASEEHVRMRLATEGTEGHGRIRVERALEECAGSLSRRYDAILGLLCPRKNFDAAHSRPCDGLPSPSRSVRWSALPYDGLPSPSRSVRWSALPYDGLPSPSHALQRRTRKSVVRADVGRASRADRRQPLRRTRKSVVRADVGRASRADRR
jgi:hypothetical protein